MVRIVKHESAENVNTNFRYELHGFKKKKLTDIGFIGFSRIRGIRSFNGFGYAINVC